MFDRETEKFLIDEYTEFEEKDPERYEAVMYNQNCNRNFLDTVLDYLN